MGRSLSRPEDYPLIHPTVALPILIAWVVATVTIITGLCASWLRRHSRPEPQTPSKPTSPPPPLRSPDMPAEETDDTALPAVLPLPPAAVSAAIQARQPPSPSSSKHKYRKERERSASMHGPIPRTVTMKATSSRRSLSMSIPEAFSKISPSKKERHEKEAEESSIWKKTIILGERCKVPSDDEDEEAAVCDEKGNRQRNYHPKTPRSVPVSRANSFGTTDPDPSQGVTTEVAMASR